MTTLMNNFCVTTKNSHSTTDEIYHILNNALPANSNKKKRTKFWFFLLFSHITVCVLSIFISYCFYTHNSVLNAISSPIIAHENRIINLQEKIQFKNLVRKFSRQEGVHINTVHNELRNTFNYRSYKQLDKKTFDKVVSYVQQQLD